MNRLKSVFVALQTLIVRTLLILVRAYQLFISPVLGNSCRFYPSCSHYCQQALTEHGAIEGTLLTVKRICRCHPGHPGGFDPVPEKESKTKESTNHG